MTLHYYQDYADSEAGPSGLCREQVTSATFVVGAFVVAVYDSDWYIGQVEGEDPDQEEEGYTLVKYMEKKGHNRFVWGTDDILKTSNNDILLLVDPPVPVSNRHMGLPAATLRSVETIFRVLWSIIFFTCQCQYELKSVTYSEIFELSLIKLT
jgi:hypothetical protein